MHKLKPSFHERIWGVAKLDPWFPDSLLKAGGSPIGEVWFESEEIPLLVKFLFTSENLSVQVHPADEYAAIHHGSAGKTEMWHVLAAKPGARIAAGFREPVSAERARAAALSGEIKDMLEWHPAARGDTFLIPAGTIHAIGGGLTICEIQQRSDITYRLYDFGRGRELHLDHALAVSRLERLAPRQGSKVECKYFITDRVEVDGTGTLAPIDRPSLLIAIEGEGQINGRATRAGDVWHVEADSKPLNIGGRIHFLHTSSPNL